MFVCGHGQSNFLALFCSSAQNTNKFILACISRPDTRKRKPLSIKEIKRRCCCVVLCQTGSTGANLFIKWSEHKSHGFHDIKKYKSAFHFNSYQRENERGRIYNFTKYKIKEAEDNNKREEERPNRMEGRGRERKDRDVKPGAKYLTEPQNVRQPTNYIITAICHFKDASFPHYIPSQGTRTRARPYLTLFYFRMELVPALSSFLLKSNFYNASDRPSQAKPPAFNPTAF